MATSVSIVIVVFSHLGLVFMLAELAIAKSNRSPNPAMTLLWFLKTAILPPWRRQFSIMKLYTPL